MSSITDLFRSSPKALQSAVQQSQPFSPSLGKSFPMVILSKKDKNEGNSESQSSLPTDWSRSGVNLGSPLWKIGSAALHSGRCMPIFSRSWTISSRCHLTGIDLLNADEGLQTPFGTSSIRDNPASALACCVSDGWKAEWVNPSPLGASRIDAT